MFILKLLILSHFDFLYGPQIVLKAPESVSDEELEKIPALMDLYEKGFFVHIFGKFKSVNLIFELPSEYARGTKELLLISYLVDAKNDVNDNVVKKLLKQFATELKKIEDAYKGFYVNSEVHHGDEEVFKKIQLLFSKFFESFPIESVVIKRKRAKIFLFGLTQAGKTTIVNCLRNSYSKNPLPTTNVHISRVNLEDLSILVYDAPGQIKFHDLWFPYLKNQNGLVFVLDLADEEKLPAAKKILHKIADNPQVKDLPLLILLNKKDLISKDIKDKVEFLELDKLENHPHKYFVTSAINNDGIEEAFNWLSLQLSAALTPYSEIELGLIFSLWDENDGLKNILVYPDAFTDDHELIAVRCFSISQFIFGGESFKRATVVLPFTNLKAKAAIYFDIIPNDKIRGGNLPISLVVFYNEKIPRAIIDQFNILIFEKLTELKKYYHDRNYITNELKKIYESIKEKLNTYKPTIRALRIAELRYQALFKAARDAIIIIDRKSGIIIDANEQMEFILNQLMEDIIGMHISQIKLKDESMSFMDEVYRIVKLYNPPLLELELLNSNGEVIPIEINANEIQMGGQNLIQCILRDITERKLAQKNLENSEKKFRYLFENSPFTIMLINQKGLLVDSNPAIEDLTGYRKKDLLYNRFADLTIIHKEDFVKLTKELKNLVKGKPYTHAEIRINRKDKSIIWTSIQSTLIKIGGEKYIQLIADDITEQKQAEQIIKTRLKSEKIISAISSRFIVIEDLDQVISDSLRDIGRFSNSDRASFYLFDDDNISMRISHEWINQEEFSLKENLQYFFIDTFPWWKKRLEKGDFIQILNVEKLPEDARATKDLLESQGIQSLLALPIFLREGLTGYLILEKTCKDSWRDDDYAVLGIFSEFLSNALQRNKAEKQLKESEQKYHQAYDRANFYKELFAHDMNRILNNVEQMIKNVSSKINNDQRRDNIGYIINNLQDQVSNGHKLINNVQKLSKLEESGIKLEKIEIKRILEDVFRHFESVFLKKKIRFKIKPDENFYVSADDILFDVFENILFLDIYNNKNKHVDIEIKITKEIRKNNNYITMKFIDNGLEVKDMNHIEEEGDNRGMLLRLSLVDRILTTFDGEIWVEGSNFVISIPEG
ncbi:MAG: PAS domain S-box protein [Candidatus Lokiarchaeota archaeon]|nr:PAS domain S-box protein [Candidatus Lokiarchaeota archaeon]MBD3200388.1 PAS domain S-box protein [Candidatus Lokiarchaeota archaeon]